MPTLAGAADLVETIGDRIVTLIRAIPEIEDAKVGFGQAYLIAAEQMPFVSVEIGPDVPFDPDGQISSSFTDSEVQIDVDLYDRRTGDAALRRILKRRALVHAALMADETLGLSFVARIQYAGAQPPVSDEEGGLPGWYCRVSWLIHYRFNTRDRSIYP